MVPNDWQVRDMSDFFGRALKRQLHERSHWQSKLNQIRTATSTLTERHIVIKALSAGQNMHISEEYARTVGRQPPIIEYPPTPPYAPPGETAEQPRMTLSDMGSPDEGSIADIEYRSILEKRSDRGEKSPIVEKLESKETKSSDLPSKEGSIDPGLHNKEVIETIGSGRPEHLL